VKTAISQAPTEEIVNIDLDNLHFFTSAGCPKCSGIGYQGRIGIFEVLDVNQEMITMIETGDLTESTVIELAKSQQMITMLQDGFIKATEGITSVEEVLRVAA